MLLFREKEHYEKLQTTGYFQKSYEDLMTYESKFKPVFNLPEGINCKPNVFEYKKDYTGLHPTQKPVALLEDLINTYSNINDSLLDFTMGSGSTGVVCINTNRNFIGIEMDDSYFDIAEKRIKETLDNKKEN